jgi:Flp pilus assembly protein TadD
MRRSVVIGFLLVVTTFLVYWPVSQYPFIAYDDPEYVANNPAVKEGLSFAGVGWAFSHLIVSNWHPLTTLSHMLDCELFGTTPGAHHVVNLVFHAVNAVLLLLLLNRITRAPWRSALVASVFALHPLHVESVAWISERKDLLSTFFFLLTLMAYASYAEKTGGLVPELHSTGGTMTAVHSASSAPSRWRWYGATCLLFVLGLLCKPMLVTLPFVLLLLDRWPLERFNFDDQKSKIKMLIREKLPLFAISLTWCIVTLLTQRAGGAMKISATLTGKERIANVLVSYYGYVTRTFWPSKLAVIYPHPALGQHFFERSPVALVLVIALALVSVSALCIVSLRKRPWLAVGWFWFLGTLVPVIGLIQVGAQAMADRYMYLPLIGLSISLVWAFAELAGQFSAKNAAGHHGTSTSRMPELPTGTSARPLFFASVAIAILVSCAAATRYQVLYWRNTTALFEHTVDVTDENPIARSLLALGLQTEGRTEEAIVQYRIVAAADPQFQCHLAQLLSIKQSWAEAQEHYEAAIKSFPDDIRPRLGLAEVLRQLGREQEAVGQLQAALRIDSNSLEALNNLAWLRATSADPSLRNGTQAVDLAQRACQLTQFGQTSLVGTLAAAYAEAGRFEEAVTTAQQACDLASSHGEQSLLEKNQELLQSYRDHRPFHRTPSHPTR